MAELYSGLSQGQRVQRPDNDVDITSAKPQTGSHLFVLPAEIRVQIYEYVFGTGKVHIIWRESEPRGRPFQLESSSEVPQRIKQTEWRLSYTICKNPDGFSRAYALSKVPANLSEPYFRPNSPEDEYGCEHCTVESAHSSQTYDPPELGLKRLHAKSALNLAILGTCKQIYHEARSLPYTLFVFDGRTASILVDWIIRSLTPSQAAAVESIHIDGACAQATDYLSLLRHLPCLKTLRLSCDVPFAVSGADCNWKKFFRRSTIDCVEVIFGWDRNSEDVDHLGHSPYDRIAAAKLERYLLSSSLEEADAAAGWNTSAGNSPLYDYETDSGSSAEIMSRHESSDDSHEQWSSDDDSALEEITERNRAAWRALGTT